MFYVRVHTETQKINVNLINLMNVMCVRVFLIFFYFFRYVTVHGSNLLYNFIPNKVL